MELQSKTIVITGAARGLGAAMARRLAPHTPTLALVDLTADSLGDTAAACRALGAEVQTYGANVAREADVVKLFDQIVRDCGGVDALVNNAGITRDALLVKFKDGKLAAKMSLEQWQSVIDVNLTGVFLCGREAAQRMIEGGRKGCIINISSISRAGNMGQTNYTAAKAGVAAMAVDLGQGTGPLRHPRGRGGAGVHQHGDGGGHEAGSAGEAGVRHSAQAHGRARRDRPHGGIHPAERLRVGARVRDRRRSAPVENPQRWSKRPVQLASKTPVS